MTAFQTTSTVDPLASYPHLFSPLTVRGVVFRNRVTAAPMTTARTVEDNLTPTAECIDGYELRARGGVSQVTVTETFVDFDRAARHDHSLDLVGPSRSVRHLEALHILAESIAVHGAIPSIELNHAGLANHPSTIASGKNPIGPNGFVRDDGVTVEAMDEAAMREVAAHFADAAAGAAAAGFRMVMLHGGHGWLLGQFTSPLTNHRTDRWGGSTENRARFPLLVIDAIRQACPDLLIEYRMSGAERVPGGLEIDEAARFAAEIAGSVDLIHVTSGLYHNHVRSKAFSSSLHPHGCNLDLARAVKRVVDIPVVAVGGFNHPQQIEDALAAGDCDLVALGRQLLADPQFVAKTGAGRVDEIAPCLRCSCFNPLAPDPARRPQAKPFDCTVNPTSMRELRLQWAPRPTGSRRVLVVGGGPAGMYAAITAAERGHQVTLVEKSDALGGLLWFTDHDSHKEDIRRYRDSLVARVRRTGVDVHTGTTATAELIRAHGADAVICAIGADPVCPPIPGAAERARHVLEMYRTPETIGRRVVIIGGGLVGVECGMTLAQDGRAVEILEIGDDYARDAFPSHREAIDLFWPETLSIRLGVTVGRIDENEVVFCDRDGATGSLGADSVLYAVGFRPDTAQVEALLSAHPNTRLVGDANRPATVLQATRDALFAAYDVL